jgi:ATP-dependent DNA helicase RecQ
LIYVRSRRDSEELFQLLQSLNYSTAAYHAGLSSAERRRIEREWLTDRLQFVICTSAFGMGIDKKDVRWVVHFQAPQLLPEYLQEVGRGGRDGQLTQALTLISEPTGFLEPSDRQRQQFLTQQQQQQERQARSLLKHLPRQGKLETILKPFPTAEIALALLYGQEQLEWLDPFTYRLLPPTRPRQQQPKSDLMRSYLTTQKCRWQFLLSSFGFFTEADRFTCGHCDNCRRI